MKPKHIALIVLLVAIGATIWTVTHRSGRDLSESASRIPMVNVDASVANLDPENLPSTGNVTRAWTPPNKVEYITDLLRRQRKATDEWRAHIDFYGKVVDETGTPIENADVSFSWNNLSGTQTDNTKSDATGLFSLLGEQGKYLTVEVAKKGYYTSAQNPPGFFYAGRNNNFTPDESNPVVFSLHKKKAAEALVHTTSRHKIPLQGQPTRIDLASGNSVSAGGGLILHCISDYESRIPGKKFDWQLAIVVPDGGIIESEEEFDFEAPEDGYQPSVEISMPAILSDGWEEIIQRKFFLKLADGNYARISFKFYSYNGVLRLETFMNPSGSRNLEYDEGVQQKPAFYE